MGDARKQCAWLVRKMDTFTSVWRIVVTVDPDTLLLKKKEKKKKTLHAEWCEYICLITIHCVTLTHWFWAVLSVRSALSAAAQVPPSSQRWQRGPHGGRHSCQRKRLGSPRTTLAQTLTLLHKKPTSKESLLLLLPPRPPATSPCLSTSPRRAPASSAMTPSMTPTWIQSSTSRRVAGTWRCRARVDLKRRRGCARPFLYRRKRQKMWRRGERKDGDSHKEKEGGVKDCFTKMLEKEGEI